MDAAEALALLVRAALGATAAILVIALLRRPLRRWLGAPVAYALWALLPAMMLAAAFGRSTTAGDAAAPALMLEPAMAAATAAPLATGGGIAFGVALLALWVVGALVTVAIRALQQWRWRRALGPLAVEADGIARADAHASLPALVGWPRPRVVLPADFALRFKPSEQALVIAHERRHLARGDLHAQLAFELLRALLWFHPLLHWASARFRHDQELACDAEVLATRPRDATDYARALLRTTAVQLPPLATAWGSVHPLKERLAMLQQSPRSPRARRAGFGAMVVLVALLSSLSWASLPRESPVPDGKLRQTWTLQVDGGPKLGPFLLVETPGVPVEIPFEHVGETWTLRSAADALADGTFAVHAQVLRGSTLVSSPSMVISEEGGSISIAQDIAVDTASGALSVSKGITASVHVEAGDGTAVAATVPRYPAGLAKAGVEGMVILRVNVSAEGRATGVEVHQSSGHASLDEAAMARVREWRFAPAMKDGAPAAGEVLVPVEFRADGKPPADG